MGKLPRIDSGKNPTEQNLPDRPPRILIVDDSRTVRFSLQQILSHAVVFLWWKQMMVKQVLPH